AAVDAELRVERAQRARPEHPAARVEVDVERRADRGGDVTGDRVDRLDLAAVARRGAGVEEGDAPETGTQLVALDDAMPCVREAGAREPGGAWRPRDVARQRLAGLGPGLDPTIQHTDPFAIDPTPAEPEVVEHPPQPSGDPTADVVVADHSIAVTDPGRTHPGEERLGGGERVTTRRAQPIRVGQVGV